MTPYLLVVNVLNALIDPVFVRVERLFSDTQVINSHLLALARRQGGKLASFDRK